MRLAGIEELNAVRGSEGSGRIMAADAPKVKREGFIFSSLVPHSSNTWIFTVQCATAQPGEETKWQDFS